MVGISLTAEQIRAAPPEVRHWLEQQVGALFAPLAEAVPPPPPPHLALLNPGDAQAVLEQIEDILPVVTVFFELGREAASVPVQGMRVFRLSEILRHTRLESNSQVVDCLDVITDALRHVRQDPQARLCAVDREGRCFVAEQTSHAILMLWQGIVAARALQPGVPAASGMPAMAQPPADMASTGLPGTGLAGAGLAGAGLAGTGLASMGLAGGGLAASGISAAGLPLSRTEMRVQSPLADGQD